MFRKLVSNLSYSPALVGQLGFYAKRLKGEETTRRIGLVFIALSLVVQSLVVFQPPESANAASGNDFVSGGLGTESAKSLDNFIRPYDANSNHLKDILNYFGITREELTSTTYGSWKAGEKLSWGFEPKFSYAQGERAVNITDANGNSATTVYGRPNKLFNGTNTNIYGWYGHSSKIGWFAIMQVCGNLVTETLPPPPEPPKPQPTPLAECSALAINSISRTKFSLSGQSTVSGGASVSNYNFQVKDSSGKIAFEKDIKSTSLAASSGIFELIVIGKYQARLTVTTSTGQKTNQNCVSQINVAPPDVCPVNSDLSVEDAECQPCPGDDSLWIKNPLCSAKIVLSKKANNTSQSSIDATKSIAQANDQIRYSLSVENTGLISKKVDLIENLKDILEYSTLIDNGGGTFDATSKTLSWPSITLEKGEKQSRVFAVRLIEIIPATAQGQSEPTSFNCIMTNTFGNQVDISVNCPSPKVIEQVVGQLPKTGPTENILFGGILLSIAMFFYARTRQIKSEVRLIRRNINTGTI